MPDDFDAVMKEAVKLAAQKIEAKIMENLTKPMPWEETRKPSPGDTTITDTGNLLRSVSSREGEMSWTIHIEAPYAAEVEFGTPPTAIPVEPLQRWAKRKLRLSEEESKVAAKRIQRSIAKFGKNPHPFARPAINEVMSEGNR